VETKPKKDRAAQRRNRNKVLAQVRLIGTVLESGRSLAVLADATGDIHLCGVGEVFAFGSDRAEVESIDFQKVSLSVDGKLLTLRMQ
jgi:hypothetical protein